MNREIKFRAWDKNIEVMTEPENLHLNGTGLISIYYQNCDYEESGWECDPSVLENVVLMQYTGLKDKNGVESYFDDLIKVMGATWQVIWDQPCALSMLKRVAGKHVMSEIPIHNVSRGEVIGNIWEHPELLEKK